MTAVFVTVGVWIGLVLLGCVLYYLYMEHMPDSIKNALLGIKTKVFGVIVAVAPDMLNILVAVQSLGDSWAPSETVTWVMRGIGVVIVLLRTITDHEKEA